jgi:hypothetical protein
VTSAQSSTHNHGAAEPSEIPSVRFDTKVALAVRNDLAVWQRLNVTAFLATAIAGAAGEIIGGPYRDADGTAYLAMCRQPITILEGNAAELASSLHRALDRDLLVAVYTADMFATTHDDANRAAVRAVPRDRLALVGVATYGSKGAVDKALRNMHLHR